MPINTITFSGNLGADATFSQTPDGSYSIINFPVTCQMGYGDRQKTAWLQCSKFFKDALGAEKFQRQLIKGRKITVQGQFYDDSYEKDGDIKHRPSCQVSQVDFSGALPEAKTPTDHVPPDTADAFKDDEIPF